jgi:hypothetical protein
MADIKKSYWRKYLRIFLTIFPLKLYTLVWFERFKFGLIYRYE